MGDFLAGDARFSEHNATCPVLPEHASSSGGGAGGGCVYYGFVCKRHDQQCEDGEPDEIHAVPIGGADWRCVCKHPSTGIPGDRSPAFCTEGSNVNECTANEVFCRKTGAICNDPDKTRLGNWLCVCPDLRPPTGRRGQRFVSCTLDECAEVCPTCADAGYGNVCSRNATTCVDPDWRSPRTWQCVSEEFVSTRSAPPPPPASRKKVCDAGPETTQSVEAEPKKQSAELEKTRTDLERARKELEEERERAAQRGKEAEQRAASVAELEEKLAKAGKRAAKLDKELGELKGQLQQAKAKADTIPGLQKELEDARKRGAEGAAVERRIKAAEGQAQQLKGVLSRTEEILVRSQAALGTARASCERQFSTAEFQAALNKLCASKQQKREHEQTHIHWVLLVLVLVVVVVVVIWWVRPWTWWQQ
eukprot:TRINITY_DN10880_c0_g1_i1.p1 TRINITY_DN10880_c0_g1~~TRINITY_DN10880_c0_g1_i1.p1  ORF type:complete len:490 (+),score=137.83 TRINITY_DN10880_c0_g1_i1:212-1471(+)